MFFTTTRALVLLAVCAIPTFAVQSANATASNYVEVHTSAGGNSVVHTSVSESSSASVDITTVINGETVIDLHEVSNGEPIVIETTRESTDGSRATARVDLHTQQEPSNVRSNTQHEWEKATAWKEVVAPTTLPPTPKALASLPEELVQPALITNVIDATDEPHYVLDEESHDDPLVTRIMHSVVHTLTYVFTIFF